MTANYVVALASRRLPLVIMLTAAALCASSAIAQAPVPPAIVDSSGFEAPKFDTTFLGTGQLEGQTPATFNGTWLRTRGDALSTADVVANSVGGSGAQVVEVNRAAGSDDWFGVPVDGYPAGDFICISWDMRVEMSSPNNGGQGPFFGMQAYEDDVNALGILGLLGVDAASGTVLYQQQDTLLLQPTGEVVTPGTWHNYMVELDYTAKTYSYWLDGVLLGSEGFVDENFVVGGLDEFTDANITAIAAGGDNASQMATGTAYFDNFVVIEGVCIPEPSVLALGVLGMAGIAAIRRKRVA